MPSNYASLATFLGRLWCRLFHAAPMWPIQGYYRCPDCLRTYPVAWANRPVTPVIVMKPVTERLKRAA